MSHPLVAIKSALDEMPPRKREELVRHCIQDAFSQLPEKDKEIIGKQVDTISEVCEGYQLGPAAALELLAKLGMFLSKTA